MNRVREERTFGPPVASRDGLHGRNTVVPLRYRTRAKMLKPMLKPSVLLKAQTYLESFTSHAAIAKECRILRIKGRVLDGDECPVARLLLKKFRMRFQVQTGYFCLVLPRSGEGVSLPLQALEFATDFDDGLYPGLVEKNKK